jgi:hypothetical protein
MCFAGTTYFRSAVLHFDSRIAQVHPAHVSTQPSVMLMLSLLRRSLLPWQSADIKAAPVPQHGAVFRLHSADPFHARLVGRGVLHRPRLLDSLCVLPSSLSPAYSPITFTHTCSSTVTATCMRHAIAQCKLRATFEYDLSYTLGYVCADGTTSSQLGNVRDTVLTLVCISTLSGIRPCRVVTHAAVLLLPHCNAGRIA